jgi:asparagine synthetase B (glutamine-hydrolysing)
MYRSDYFCPADLILQRLRKVRAGNLQQNFKAFTIGFDDKSHDETEAAALVAKSLGLEHYVEKLTAESALSMMGEATEMLDEPLADAAVLPQLLLSRFARKQVTVALSGDGGDELLMGYQHIPAHRWLKRCPKFRAWPRVFQRKNFRLEEGISVWDLKRSDLRGEHHRESHGKRFGLARCGRCIDFGSRFLIRAFY